jgi:hypothetical protein
MPEAHFPRISLLRLSEKGTSKSPSEDLAAIRSAKWTEKPLLGDPLGSAGSVSETFRTVSLGSSVNKGTARTPSTLSLGARSLPKIRERTALARLPWLLA